MDEFSWMYDIGFIRWLSQFFSEDRLGPVFAWFRRQLEGETPSQMAGKLFGWAIALAALVAVIDQIMYWTRRDQQSKARRFAARCRLLWRYLRRLAVERMSGAIRRTSPDGRR
jgi:hypothetical protein